MVVKAQEDLYSRVFIGNGQDAYSDNYPGGVVANNLSPQGVNGAPKNSVRRSSLARCPRALIESIAKKEGMQLHTLEVMPDHLHIFLEVPPQGRWPR